MDNKKIQWHPGFAAALDLELRQNRSDLKFEREHNLNTKPLEIDLLVIKKNANVQINNEVGRIFRGHNIIEYKSPDDRLDIDTFYKVGAYASLYKSYGRTLDEIRADDVTVSLVRERCPVRLFETFKKYGGYSVSQPSQGLYYVEGRVLFPTQIIVTGELGPGEHIWLKALSKQMDVQSMEQLFENVRELTGKYDRELADSVLDICVRANKETVKALLEGGETMSGALLEIMEPVIREKEAAAWDSGNKQGISQGIRQGISQGIGQGLEQGLEQGIQGTVSILRDIGLSDPEIARRIMEQYHLSESAAAGYLASKQA